MPTMVTTSRGTGTLDTATQLVRDVSPAIAQLEPDAGPLCTILMKAKSKAAKNPKFEWFEDELGPRFDVLAAAIAAADTATITVTYREYFRIGDLVQIGGPTGEIVCVTTTPTSTGSGTVAVTRGFGESAAATAANLTSIEIIGNANEEGADVRGLLSTQRTAVYNYCQILRHPFGFTNTAEVSDNYGDPDSKEEQRKQLIEHKRQIELTILLGQRYTATGTHPKRTSRGLVTFISTNVQDMEGEMTEPEFEELMRRTFRFGSSTKVVFASSLACSVLNSFARGKIQSVSGDKSYGVSLKEFQTFHGKVLINWHKLMENSSATDVTGIAGQMIIADIEDLMLRYMKGRFTVLLTNRQGNGVDGKTHEYLSEIGLQLTLEKKHGRAVGITG